MILSHSPMWQLPLRSVIGLERRLSISALKSLCKQAGGGEQELFEGALQDTIEEGFVNELVLASCDSGFMRSGAGS
uniref:Uncharacterized protein n=1 Tax=Thermosporothrix sp. COM3 TaxID=2490863 RepID=A0A455SN78_9CHLR|nr:hypothetical protein KTC_33920 [Thermosporothrix sp. COM3]